jgi:hypothetical protein
VNILVLQGPLITLLGIPNKSFEALASYALELSLFNFKRPKLSQIFLSFVSKGSLNRHFEILSNYPKTSNRLEGGKARPFLRLLD